MSEKLQQGPEQTLPSPEVSQESEANLKRLQEAAKNDTEASSELVQGLEAAAKTEAVSGKEMNVTENEGSQQSPLGMHRQLKEVAYDRSMERVRSTLPKPARAFSKLIHTPAVDAVSEGVGKTMARPSGILGGGVAALIGSLILVYVTRHYGFTYNYLLFILLYIGGYCFGLVIELIFKAFKRKA